MTIELDCWTTSVYAVIAATAAFYALAWAGLTMHGINTEGFVAQIWKLIAANNIDRAIKLCKVEPDDPLADGVRRMLLQKNTEGIMQAHEEAVAAVRAWAAKYERPHGTVGAIVLMVLVNLFMWQMNPTGPMIVALLCATVLQSCAFGKARELRLKAEDYTAALLKVRGQLVGRREGGA